jgi:hypothetical protein
MKKLLIVGALVVVAALSFGFAGSVYAQTVQPPTVEPGYGPGMMGGRNLQDGGYRMGGMMGGFGQQGATPGFMHDEMTAAFAEKLGMTVDELNTRLQAGDTMFDIAVEKGLSQEEFRTIMTDARSKALDAAVASGELTQEQADFMKQRGAGRMGFRNQDGNFGGCPFGNPPVQQ